MTSPDQLAFHMLDWSSCSAVERNSDTVSGAWGFRGTRVPVQALFANLEDGARIDDFLEWFRARLAARSKPSFVTRNRVWP